jgi:hypothetical protein
MSVPVHVACRFIESRPTDMRALLELVIEAQLFVTFIEERHRRFVNSGKFERRLTTRYAHIHTPLFSCLWSVCEA